MEPDVFNVVPADGNTSEVRTFSLLLFLGSSDGLKRIVFFPVSKRNMGSIYFSGPPSLIPSQCRSFQKNSRFAVLFSRNYDFSQKFIVTGFQW